MITFFSGSHTVGWMRHRRYEDARCAGDVEVARPAQPDAVSGVVTAAVAQEHEEVIEKLVVVDRHALGPQKLNGLTQVVRQAVRVHRHKLDEASVY